MDYIQQAIDKAREERQGNIGQPREPGKAGATASSQQARAVSTHKGVPEVINYTATKQLSLDEATLKKNRIVAAFEDDTHRTGAEFLIQRVLTKLPGLDYCFLCFTT